MADVPDFTPIPSSLGQAFDMIHEALGCFEPLPSEGDEWWKTKRRYVGILKRICTKRNVSLRHLGIALWYAHHPENPEPPTTMFDLFGLIPGAMRTYNRELLRRLKESRQEELDAAVEQALSLGETAWAERMVRAGVVPLEWKEHVHAGDVQD